MFCGAVMFCRLFRAMKRCGKRLLALGLFLRLIRP